MFTVLSETSKTLTRSDENCPRNQAAACFINQPSACPPVRLLARPGRAGVTLDIDLLESRPRLPTANALQKQLLRTPSQLLVA